MVVVVATMTAAVAAFYPDKPPSTQFEVTKCHMVKLISQLNYANKNPDTGVKSKMFSTKRQNTG